MMTAEAERSTRRKSINVVMRTPPLRYLGTEFDYNGLIYVPSDVTSDWANFNEVESRMYSEFLRGIDNYRSLCLVNYTPGALAQNLHIEFGVTLYPSVGHFIPFYATNKQIFDIDANFRHPKDIR